MGDLVASDVEAGSTVNVVSAGVDALALSWHLPVTDRAYRRLEDARLAVDSSRQHKGRAVILQLADGRRFRSALGARAPYRFLLGGEDFQITVAPNWAPGGGQVRIECVPSSIWTLGAEALVAAGRAAARELSGSNLGVDSMVRFESLTRVDLAVDVQGVDLDGSDDEARAFVCRSPMARHYGLRFSLDDEGARRQKESRAAGRALTLEAATLEVAREMLDGDECVVDLARYGLAESFTGYTFGRGDAMVRLYNKSREIAVKKKFWVREHWEKSPDYDASKDVIRIEAQARRGLLAELGFDGWNRDRLSATWGYFIGAPTVEAPPGWRPPLRLPPSGPWVTVRERSWGDSNRRRWAVAGWWEALQQAGFGGPPVASVRARKVKEDLKALTDQILGCAESAAALMNIPDGGPEEVLRATFEALLRRGNADLFAAEVSERKRARLLRAV